MADLPDEEFSNADASASWCSTVRNVNDRRRALGQHFLRDAAIARGIVDLVAPTTHDLVLEIGPGQGALTGELARRAGRVIALEVDRRLAAELRGRFESVEVIDADAARGTTGRSWPRPA